MAIVFGCEKFHDYIYGQTVKVDTDHKPLESLFSKAIHRMPARIQRFCLRLQKYDLRISYKPGKLLVLADTLSRAFLPNSDKVMDDLEPHVNMIIGAVAVSTQKQTEIRQALEKDGSTRTLKQTILQGWPDQKKKCHQDIREYWAYRDELSVIDDLVFKGTKIVVPSGMRQAMLHRIHEGHMGIVKCKQRARQLLFWPRMNGEIEDMVSTCEICQKMQNRNQREPMQPHEIPQRPWSKVASDIFELGSASYVVVVDYYSKFPEVMRLPTTTSKSLIMALKSIFARHGIPDTLVSDNGSNYTSMEFKEFEYEWDFMHVTSSPRYPRSNGLAERMVQTVKKMLQKNRDPYMAMLELRNTPFECLVGRRLRGSIPTANVLLQPDRNEGVRSQLVAQQQRQKKYYDRGTKYHPALSAGTVDR